MKVKINIQKEVEPEILDVCAKVCDSGTYTLMSKDGLEIMEHDGYVPDIMPDFDEKSGFDSDYLRLKIDLKTGKILNWKNLTDGDLQRFINGAEN